jgi:hypothetical protein
MQKTNLESKLMSMPSILGTETFCRELLPVKPASVLVFQFDTQGGSYHFYSASQLRANLQDSAYGFNAVPEFLARLGSSSFSGIDLRLFNPIFREILFYAFG